MFDDLPQKKTGADFPRDLENMSVDELQSYITDLENEIERVNTDIKSKKASQDAAAAIFKA